MVRGAVISYYHADGLGSIVALTNATGAIVERYGYDVYGSPRITDGAGTVLSQSALGNRFLFTGRELDSETGLYYYRARYYDAKVGRFLSRDPVGYSAGLNLYTYVDNNPVNFVDPLGLAKAGTWWEQFANGFLDPAWNAFSQPGFNLGAWTVDPNWRNTYGAALDLLALGSSAVGLYRLALVARMVAIRGASLVWGGLRELGEEGYARFAKEGAERGTKVYRVFGGRAGQYGKSWTTVDPRTVPNYRSAAGLPDSNAGKYVAEGILKNTENVTAGRSIPIKPGQTGGIPEAVIPNPQTQVEIQKVSRIRPEF